MKWSIVFLYKFHRKIILLEIIFGILKIYTMHRNYKALETQRKINFFVLSLNFFSSLSIKNCHLIYQFPTILYFYSSIMLVLPTSLLEGQFDTNGSSHFVTSKVYIFGELVHHETFNKQVIALLKGWIWY